MRYLLGIDLGTSGTKTVLFDENGVSVASATVEYPMYQPQNGWSEQDPADWWNAAVSTVKTVLDKSGVPAASIAGLGISGQMHGLVMLDENGEVLRRSIIWNDGRTGEECREITEIIGKDRLVEITANPALTGFTAGKIRWVQKNEPELYKRCAHILLPKDYVRYMLTGVCATEVSDASGMQLLDVPKRQWSDEVLGKLGIDKALLGSMHESCEVTGTVTAKAAALTGLKEGTPVVGGAGDNAAAAIGTGVVRTGSAFATIGTSGVVFAHSDTVAIDPQGRVHSFCSAVPGAWTVMSCTLAAGLSLKWFRDTFCAAETATAAGMGVDPYMLMDKQADRVPIGADRLLFLPYLMGERSPLLDENARGAFIGLSAIHTRQHLLRAVMEGVMYSQRHCLDVLREMKVAPAMITASGGGGTSPVWRQMMADVFGVPVNTIKNREAPALGVAILAGVGTGVYASVQEACDRIIRVNEPQAPIADNVNTYEPFYQIYRSLYPKLKESCVALAAL